MPDTQFALLEKELVTVLLIGIVFFTLLVVFLIAYVLAYKRRQLAHALETAALQHSFENQLLQSRLETQEQALQHFSEEIHDNVGQTLSVVGMYLYQLTDESEHPHLQQLAAQGSELLNKAIDDLRTISHMLNANYVTNQGLIESLRQELAYINNLKGPACSLSLDGTMPEIPHARQIMMFRIAQEAIGNSLKHGRAQHIRVAVECLPQRMRISVEDDGCGFNPDEASKHISGLGLTNMQLRADLLKGILSVSSAPGKGCCIALETAWVAE